MYAFKRGRFVTVILVWLFLGAFVLGCATDAQLKALEADTQKAMDQSEQALHEVQSIKAVAGDSAKYSSEAAESARRAEDAATRAESAARRCEEIYNRIMSK
jgi:outer membrane biogenesis lipoprotein LolB